MSPEEAVVKLQNLQQECSDPENDHILADNILCELLSSLGYLDVVTEWEKIHKWYA